MTELKGLGWLPDIPSHLDYTEDHPEVTKLLARTKIAPRLAASAKGAHKTAAPAALPPKIDLRASFSPIEDQGALGSCTAQAAVGLLEYFERHSSGKWVDASRLFLYKTERNLLGWTGDTGAFLRTAMEALVLTGAPPERYWPYNIANFDDEPSAFCYALGANYQAVKYFRLSPPGATPAQTLINIKTFLAAGFPSMFGFPVYPEYDNPAPGGLIGFPGPGEHPRGGHANVAVGYDDTLKIGNDVGALLVRNSWGTGWSLAGYGWLSYRYVLEALATDWWSMISAKWVDTGVFS
ncbi:C1 family peptidase [Methylocapsa sp. D3K7]|uniref:C1 family peptidase n=1 Tax=Methylocapsa sp. D3K7 TaxID=3041435 RepID=UPI00244EFABC|nr:C1 family peptidase [Methylocapsa sp. D3K7]WGJ15330.1 C1 family peptidase [Methylocapsa sp. D3K7]